MIRIVLIFILTVGFVYEPSRANEDYELRLNAARTQFLQTIQDLAEDVKKSLNQLEETARRTGDIERVRDIAEEREAFEKLNLLPASVPKRIFDKNAAAIAQIERAYREIMRDQLKSKNDNAIKDLEKELEQQRDSAFRVMKIDSMRKGSLWKGRDYVKGDTREWTITGTIVKADGELFTLRNERSDGGIFDYNCRVQNGWLSIVDVVRVRGGGPNGHQSKFIGQRVPMETRIIVRPNWIVIYYYRPMSSENDIVGKIVVEQQKDGETP